MRIQIFDVTRSSKTVLRFPSRSLYSRRYRVLFMQMCATYEKYILQISIVKQQRAWAHSADQLTATIEKNSVYCDIATSAFRRSCVITIACLAELMARKIKAGFHVDFGLIDSKIMTDAKFHINYYARVPVCLYMLSVYRFCYMCSWNFYLNIFSWID